MVVLLHKQIFEKTKCMIEQMHGEQNTSHLIEPKINIREKNITVPAPL